MQEIGKFLVSYWKEILLILCALISLVISLIKRKVSFTDIYQYVHKVFDCFGVFYIEAAEKQFTDGSLKKKYVLEKCLSRLKQCGDFDSKQLKYCEEEFSLLIEQVLACPQKKGK